MNKLTALAAMAAGCLSASAALDSTCYSQKGLVGHWDGIENLARGVHDASTRTWKDLAGGIGDGNLGEAVTWTDTGWSNDANGHPVIVPGTRAAEVLSSYGRFTFTLDFAFTPSRDNASQDLISTCVDSTTNFRLIHNVNSQRGKIRYNFYGKTLDSTDLIYKNEQVSYALAFTREKQRTYKNGEAFSISEAKITQNISQKINGFGIGGTVSGNDSWAMRGSFHGLRLYNRAISEEEAKLNACIDKVRFFGADPTSLIWPTGYAYADGKLSMQATVAAYPEGRGSIAVGGDAAGDSYSGSIEAGTTLVAVPAAGYRFAHWSDELGNRYGESATITVPFGVTELYAVFEDLPVTSGLAVHLDAKAGTFVERDDAGCVSAWQDLGHLANVFTTDAWNTTHADSVPRYDATAFDGQGAVRFGRKPDGTFTPTGLISSQFLLTNKTVFIVFRRDPDANGSTVPGWKDSNTPRDHLLSRSTVNTVVSTIDATGYDNWYVASPGVQEKDAFWLCGERVFDAARHYTNSAVYVVADGRSTFPDPTRGRNEIIAIRRDPERYESAAKSLWLGSEFDTSARLLCLGRCGSKNYETQMFAGWIAEVVTYDRALPDDEFLRVQNALIDKWDVAEDDGAGFVWTGAAGNGLWSDARNWDRGRVPGGDCGLLCIPDNAEITVDGTFGCGTLFLGTNVKMTIADGAVFNVPAGQRLELPDVVGCSGTVKVTGGGTLVLSNAAGGEFPTATLCLDGADLDVNGGRYVFRSVTATSGAVVNSAVATGTVGVCAPAGGASVFGAFAKGNVNVVKVGPGDVALTGFSAHSGETRFSSGAATVSETTLPSLGSLSLHLDAQDLASVVTNEDGTVAEWKDLTGVGNTFTASAWNATRPYSLPRYDPEAFDGRGGVRFGWCTTNPEFPDGVYTQTCLTCTKPVLTNLTIFVVVRLDPDATSKNCPCRNANREYVMSRVVASSWDASVYIHNNFGSWQLNPSRGGDQTAFWYNGRKYLDMPNGFMDPAVKTYTGITPNPYYVSGLEKRGATQLMVFRTAQTAYVDNYSSLWIGNGTSSTFTLGHCGAKVASWEDNMLAGWIGEIVTYPRALSDDEVCRVERVLIEKWGVTDSLETPPAPNNPLSSASTLVLEKGAELDLAGATQTVAAVAFGGGEGTGAAVVTNGVLETSTLTAVAEADGTLPLLKICGDWSLADKSLTITGYDRKPRSGTLLQTSDGVFGGKFSAVSGNGALPVRYRSQKVGLGGDGLLMLLR